MDPVYLAVGNDKLLESKTKGTVQQYLGNPQNLNAYSYALNNPVRYTDPNGEYWETIFDLVSLGLSLYDFNNEKSIFNGIFLGLDVAGTALPFPSVFGYAKNGVRGYEIAKYFHKVGKSIDNIINLGELFVKNANFKFTRKAWSKGEAGNDVGSMVGHFFKHGDEVGAVDVGDYYNKANDLISAADNKTVFELKDVYRKGTVDYFDTSTNNLVGLNGQGEISSFQKVIDPAKLNKLNEAIKNINQ